VTLPRALIATLSVHLLALLLSAGPAAAAEPPAERKLAVLQFGVGKLSAADRALLGDRLYFSERVRNVILESHPPFTLITQDQMAQIMDANADAAARCEEGHCVQQGELLGADLLVSGEFTRVGRSLILVMKLVNLEVTPQRKRIERQLASGEARGADVDELLNGIGPAVREVLVPVMGAAGQPPAQAARPTDPPPAGGRTPEGSLKVLSTPAGAKVLLDGDPAGATPVVLKREPGTYVVSIELSGYAAVSRTVELTAGKTATLREALMQAAGFIEVSVAPEAAARAARVTVDGAAAGAGKQGPFKVGSHLVRADAPGYRAAQQQSSVDSGGVAQVSLALAPLPGKLLVSVNVAAVCSAGAANAKASPESVAKLEVPAGSAHVVCTAADHEDASADAEVGPGKAQALKLELKAKPKAGAARGKAGADDFKASALLNEANQKMVAQEFAAAIALYEKALALKPGDVVLGGVYRGLGIVFTRQGNIDEGARYYRLYLPLCTNPAEKAQLQKVLDDYAARRGR
jgi:hypothetical protein